MTDPHEVLNRDSIADQIGGILAEGVGGRNPVLGKYQKNGKKSALLRSKSLRFSSLPRLK